eukprot:m.8586 g.8586  ORF g.8586 m.8586 type:complete len:516 (+) comp3927_c0_seq1:227-1774(+)
MHPEGDEDVDRCSDSISSESNGNNGFNEPQLRHSKRRRKKPLIITGTEKLQNATTVYHPHPVPVVQNPAILQQQGLMTYIIGGPGQGSSLSSHSATSSEYTGMQASSSGSTQSDESRIRQTRKRTHSESVAQQKKKANKSARSGPQAGELCPFVYKDVLDMTRQLEGLIQDFQDRSSKAQREYDELRLQHALFTKATYAGSKKTPSSSPDSGSSPPLTLTLVESEKLKRTLSECNQNMESLQKALRKLKKIELRDVEIAYLLQEHQSHRATVLNEVKSLANQVTGSASSSSEEDKSKEPSGGNGLSGTFKPSNKKIVLPAPAKATEATSAPAASLVTNLVPVPQVNVPFTEERISDASSSEEGSRKKRKKKGRGPSKPSSSSGSDSSEKRSNQKSGRKRSHKRTTSRTSENGETGLSTRDAEEIDKLFPNEVLSSEPPRWKAVWNERSRFLTNGQREIVKQRRRRILSCLYARRSRMKREGVVRAAQGQIENLKLENQILAKENDILRSPSTFPA